MDALRIKQDFPLLRNSGIVYLDSAATGQKPEVVIDAISTFYRTENGPVHRGIYELAEQATGTFEAARKAVADLINASPEEIVFTSGTTDSINTIAAAWAAHTLQKDDEIVLPVSEHHSNMLPWLELARTHGVTIIFVSLTPDFKLDIEDFLKKITPKTKLVTFALTSHIFGNYPQEYIRVIINKAHQVGAKIVLDAAQSVGHMKLDMQLLGVDFLAFSGHKLFGPTGIGVLYVNKKNFNDIAVYRMGGGMVQNITLDALDKKECALWKEMPYRLEAGTPAFAQAIGLHAAIAYIKDTISYIKLSEHEDALITHLKKLLTKYDDIVIMQPVYQKPVHSSLLSFYSMRHHAHDIAAWLSQYNIAVRAGNHCAQPIHQRLKIPASVRVSCHAYTTMHDIDAFGHALDELYENK